MRALPIRRAHRPGGRRLRPPTYPEVMSTIAVFIALGGTSYAVARNSVGTPQLKNGAVTSQKVKDGSLSASDFQVDALPRGPRGSSGPQGPQGPAGPSGPSGAGEVLQAVRAAGVAIPSTTGGSATVATLTVPAGTWSLRAQTNVRYVPASSGSEWFTCTLRTATGQALGSGTVRVGTDAGGVIASPISVHRAVGFPTAAQVVYVCSHPSPIATPAAEADQTVLSATRVERLEEQ